MAGKEKLDRLQNVLCQTSRMQRIWESGFLTWLCIYASKKKKASEKKGSLSHPGSVISFMHDLRWEVMAEPCVILKVILVFSLGERWKGRGEMGGRERE